MDFEANRVGNFIDPYCHEVSGAKIDSVTAPPLINPERRHLRALVCGVMTHLETGRSFSQQACRWENTP
jgi:hypothetical protein